MAIYSYKVKDSAGRTRTGTLEAESERQAAAMIREAGGFPMEIRPVRDSQAVISDEPAGSAFTRYFIYPIWTGISMRTLVFFYRQLATMLAAGMSLSEALRSMSERTRGPLGRIVRASQVRVQGGGRLSEELNRYPRVFTRLQVSLIRAGEQTGLLDKMAERIASYLDYELSIRRKITSATFYPFLILLFIVVEPALIALVLGTVGDALRLLLAQVRTIGMPIIVTIIACKLLFQFEPVRFAWDIVKIQPPVLGTVARKIAMSRFSRSLALLYSSGIPIAQTVSISADACANIAIGGRIKKIIPDINDGQPLTESLRKTGMMLPEVMDMLDVGEKTGSPDATLRKVADYMDDEANATLKKLPVVLFVLMMVIAGLLTLLQLMAGYTQYADQIMGSGN